MTDFRIAFVSQGLKPGVTSSESLLSFVSAADRINRTNNHIEQSALSKLVIFTMAHSDTQDSTIPVIDISNPSGEVARQVFEAASTHGFLFIKNDGVTIPPKDIDEMFKLVCTNTAF